MRFPRTAPLLGANIALLTGLALMPVVIAIGLWTDDGARPGVPPPSVALAALRGSFDGLRTVPVSGPRRTAAE